MGCFLRFFITFIGNPIRIFFLLLGMPIIIIIKGIYKLRKSIARCFAPRSSPEIHAKNVKIVQDQVLEWNRNGRKNKMCTGRPAWASFVFYPPAYKSTLTPIYIDMEEIIEVDIPNKVVRVEPLVPMGRLSRKLLELGWIVPMLPEFKMLTVGGLICGTGVETSGHKYGFFQHICVGFEVVVADGRILNCTKDENSDLFYSIPWSHGTLGFLTSATLMIIPAKKYIELEYIPVHSLDEAMSVLESQALRESGNDYVEGIMYSLDKGVITVGKMASTAAGKVNSIGRWYKLGFYKYVESFLKKSSSAEHIEYIPIRDYLHRHDRNYFWVIPMALPMANNLLFRLLFGWVFPLPTIVGLLLGPKWFRKASITRNYYILQDYVIPIGNVKEYLIYAQEHVNSYPIWLCPTKIFNIPGMCKPKTGKDEMYVDIGLYGHPEAKGYVGKEINPLLEDLCFKFNGFQFFYAESFITREQMMGMLDHELYFKVRKELNCEDAFPEVYDKISRTARTKTHS